GACWRGKAIGSSGATAASKRSCAFAGATFRRRARRSSTGSGARRRRTEARRTPPGALGALFREAAHPAELEVALLEALLDAHPTELLELALEDRVEERGREGRVRVGSAGGLGDDVVDEPQLAQIRRRDFQGA